MWVMVSGLAVLVRETSPLVVLVALNVPTVLAPFRVVPPAELVVRVPVVLTRPEPDSDRAPLAVRLTAPPPADMLPVTLMLPVLLTVTEPPPPWVTPETVRGAAVLVRDTLPLLVLVAL